MAYRKYNKYGNKKVVVDGMEFDSRKEANRYFELRTLQRCGVIKDLQRQVKFELIPAYYDYIPTGEMYVRGDKKGSPKFKQICVEQSVDYYADFVYTKDGKQIVEDTKGFRTADYIIKRKLMLYKYGIRIVEV